MIEADKLVKDYGPIRAVDNVSFKVEKGDVLGFLGPNGAGKSTSMKMITGFLRPTSGTARIGEIDVRENPIEAKKLFGYLPESGPLYEEMTVMEFLDFICSMRGICKKKDKTEKIQRVVEICHLEGVRNQPIDTLSKGFRQRVGMAQAVIHDPACLIMDEPTDGLDPNQKLEVRKFISSMAEEKAIILSTHILEEVEAMCNRVIIIANGKILVDETPENLRKRHPHFNAVRLKIRGEKGEVKEFLNGHSLVKEIVDESGQILVVPKNGENIDETLFQAAKDKNWQVTQIEKPHTGLEEVFANLTK